MYNLVVCLCDFGAAKSKTPLQATGYQACSAAEQRGIRPSRQSPNGHASMSAWLVARGNKF